MKLTEKYEFDAQFYAIVIATIAVLGLGFYFVKRSIDRAHGREIQSLLNQAGVDSPEAAKKWARNYVNSFKARDKLTPDQVKKAEEIFVRAFLERMDIWREDRLRGAATHETKNRQSESWGKFQREYETMRQ